MIRSASRVRACGFAITALAAILAAGCQRPGGSSHSTQGSSPNSAGGAGAAELRVVDREKYDEAIRQHAGKVVLVDFWATWCTTCQEQFPHNVELAEKYHDRGLVLVTVSLDDAEAYPQAAEFLRDQKTGEATHLVSEFGANLESMNAFDLPGAIPHYRLYGRDGKIRHDFEGEPEGIEEKIEALLAEEG